MDFDKVLNSGKEDTVIYFEMQEHFEEKYGRNSVVLFEKMHESDLHNLSYTELDAFNACNLTDEYKNYNGTFFEVYEVNNEELQIGKAKEIAELLNIQLTRKNKSILESVFYTYSVLLNELIKPSHGLLSRSVKN